MAIAVEIGRTDHTPPRRSATNRVPPLRNEFQGGFKRGDNLRPAAGPDSQGRIGIHSPASPTRYSETCSAVTFLFFEPGGRPLRFAGAVRCPCCTATIQAGGRPRR